MRNDNALSKWSQMFSKSQVGEMSWQLWRQKQWAGGSRGPGGAWGSQGANQVFQRFNSFVRCLIGCLSRLGFLWPQLETSVKRLDGHSESVNCFQQSAINCPTVSQVKTRSMSDYLSCSRSFHRELYFQAACLHACFCLFCWGHCTSLRCLLLDINSPVFTSHRIEPAPLFRRHHQPAGSRHQACLELLWPGFALVQLLSDLRQDYTKTSF